MNYEHLRMSVRMACYSKKKTPIYVPFLYTVNDFWSVTNKLKIECTIISDPILDAACI